MLPAHNQHQNKFNTISNIHKRSGGAGHLGRSLLPEDSSSPGIEPNNHFDKNSILLSRRAMPGLELGGANTVYHMGTMSRASISKQSQREREREEKNQQVVDSAYGTTRSVKKVYL